MLTPVVEKLGVKPRAALVPATPEWDDGQNSNSLRLLHGAKSEPMADLLARAMRADSKEKLRTNRSGKYLIEIGDFHFANKSFGRAEKAYKEASVEQSFVVQAYRKLINLYDVSGNIEEAVKVFDNLINLSVKKPTYHIEKISFLLNHFSPSSNSDIQKSFKDALCTFPDNVELLNLRGIFSLVTDSPADAEKYFDKVLKIDTNNVHAANNKGVSRFGQEDADGAIKYYWKAISIDLNYLTGYENLAALYTKLELHTKALNVLSKAVENKNKLSNEWDHQYGYLLLKTGKRDQAIEWYKNKLTEEPKNNLLYNNLGFCYEHTGNNEEAKKNYAQAVKLAKEYFQNGHTDDRYWLAFYNLMNLYDKSQDDAELLRLVNYVMSYQKNDWRALFFKGSIELRSENYTEALSLYRKVEKLNPDFVDTYVQMGFLYESVWKDYETSINLHKKAAKLFGPPNPVIDNNLAFAYLKSGDIKKAEALLKTYKNFKGYPPLLATFGLYYFMTDKPEEANKMYAKALNLFDGKGDEKKVLEQVWLNEKAKYESQNDDIVKALGTINKSIRALDHGYSYKDALEIKEQIIDKAQEALFAALKNKS